jgi:nanoRNase/pAp phosphatase (c-di-AMP/oligoRNAs hydrolase)
MRKTAKSRTNKKSSPGKIGDETGMNILEEIFGTMKEDARVAIFTHPGPDPDAMGSCIGMQYLLLKKWGVSADIFMEGDYSARRSNSAMVNVLGIDLRQMEVYIKNRKSYEFAIVLDATPERVNEDVRKDISIVIDHHSVQVQEEDFNYVDIRKVGSCSTMVFELMQLFECIPDDVSEEARIVATALLEGIRTDTDMYRRVDTTVLDFNASSILFELADMEMINQIERCRLPRYHFDMRAEIVRPDSCDIVNGSTYIACAGCISKAKVDSLPILADEVINDMEGITTSIIFAIVDGKVELSMRSNEVAMDVNRFLKKHFGDYGGAKDGSGGAHIPLGIFGMANLPTEMKDDVYDLTKKVVITILSRDVKSE